MNGVMNQDTFLEYKEKLINLVNKINDGNDVLDEYYKTLNNLLSYDLGRIFPNKWQGLTIVSDENHITDFSKTNATINFNYMDINGYADFRNCKIINLKSIEGKTFGMTFDRQVYLDNSDIFLSNIFSKSIKDKYDGALLTFDDLVSLDFEQLKELRDKNIVKHLNNDIHYIEFINCLGFTRALELYEYYHDDYEYAESIFKVLYEYKVGNNLQDFDSTFMKVLEVISVNSVAKYLDNILTKSILKKTPYDPDWILINNAPEKYKENHEEIYLRNVNMPDFLRNDWYSKSVNYDDFLEYIDLFKGAPFVYFISRFNKDVINFANQVGYEPLRLILKYHHDVFEYFKDDSIYFFKDYCKDIPTNLNNDSFERWFLKVIKNYIYKHQYLIESYMDINGKKKYILHSNFNSMNINIISSYNTINDFFHHSRYDLVLDDEQHKVLDTFNINNLEKLCNETGILSLDSPRDILKQVYVVLTNRKEKLNANMINYNDFCNSVVEWIEQLMYHGNIYLGNLDKVEGPFRERYPSIFMDKNAPDELKTTFYYCNINSKIIYEYKNYIKYLYDKNLKFVIKGNFEFLMENDIISIEENFLEYYSNRFGNPALLEIFTKYGFVFKRIGFSCLFSLNENMSKEEIDNKIVEYIYIRIIDYRKDGYIVYKDLKDVPEFYNKYPQIFLTEEDIELLNSKYKKSTVKNIEDEFYDYCIDSTFIQQYPILIDILKNKNLQLIMDSRNNYNTSSSDNNFYYSDYDIYYNLISYLGNETYLKALYKYGPYLENAQEYLSDAFFDSKNSLDKGEPLEYYCTAIEDAIVKYCYLGGNYYRHDAPKFLKENHPELFLDENVPDILHYSYYPNLSNDINFDTISIHPEWLPYLKDKRISQVFLRNRKYDKDIITHYFNILGENDGLKLGFRYPDIINKMLHSKESVDLVKRWYDKTGGRFIPNNVVMQAFDISEADKFLANGRKWSKLMSIKEFSYSDETVDALLKLAYAFGIFDNDSKGYNQLYELLTTSPKTISKETYELLKEKEDDSYTFRDVGNALGIKGDKLIDKIYTKKNDSEYELTIEKNVNKDVFSTLNICLTVAINYPVLTGFKAHSLFGRFKLQYDPKFREFLFNNLSTILSNDKYSKNIASIQRNFKNICAINSNRKLTLDMALNYVSTIKYSELDTVNDNVARISSIAGYEQEEFSVLQNIYNYGKQRVYSSIPRIESKTDEFHYEMLRLDDPLALAIGTLTDCCQELGDQAEWCMQHSMTSADGRVFVVKDFEENIISQSWVWRNNNTICFDNIEIPNKVFERYDEEYIAKKVYDVYKQAALEIIEKDKEKYKELLDNKIITEDEYSKFILNKVTVGLGYNDIANVIRDNAKKDTNIVHPLDYKGPVKLTYGPYTNDSKEQYVLESVENGVICGGKNLAIFNDEYKILDEYSLDSKELLNIISFDRLKYDYSEISEYFEENSIPMKAISKTYNCNISDTKVLKSANFVIIYSVNDNIIKLHDIIINDKVEINGKKVDITSIVIEQLSLALKQIINNSKFDTIELDSDAKELFDSAIKIENQIKIK